MINNFNCVCSEVYECLNILGKSYIEKIPEHIYKEIELNKDKDYISKYDSSIGITEETFSEEALNFIAVLDYKYWCTNEKKKQKEMQYFENEKAKQEHINEKYNPNNIFINNSKESIHEIKEESINKIENKNECENDMKLIEIKESFFSKIRNIVIDFIKKIKGRGI